MNMMHKKGGGKMRQHRRFQHRGGNNRGGDHNNIARQKHHATQMREKFNNLAKDAQANGEVVDMEYYLQHVDHYQRVLSDIAVIEGERTAERQAQQQNDQPAEGDDAAEGGETQDAQDAQAQGEPRQRRQHRPRHERGDRPERTEAQADKGGEIPLPSSMLQEIPASS